ncbi:hypothetical protein ACRV61_004333 [Escherichia albertii]
MIDFLVSFIIFICVILPSVIAFGLFSFRYIKMMRVICFSGAVILFIIGGCVFFHYEYGITHRDVRVQGTIIDRHVCIDKTLRGPVNTGYCANLSYLDNQQRRHTIALPFQKTDYAYFNHAVIVYDRNDPEQWRITSLDNKIIKINKFNSTLLIYSLVLLMWGGILQLTIDSPFGKKNQGGNLLKDISLLLSYIRRVTLCR